MTKVVGLVVAGLVGYAAVWLYRATRPIPREAYDWGHESDGVG